MQIAIVAYVLAMFVQDEIWDRLLLRGRQCLLCRQYLGLVYVFLCLCFNRLFFEVFILD